MRLLHTSDWHLGKSLETVPLAEHQRVFLGWLADLARERGVEAILVSGDVHDRAVPSVDAVRLLQSAMVDLVRICPVVFISGNHDSPTRLGFGGPLLEAVGVHLRSTVDDIDRPIDITGADGVRVLIYGVPYLEPEIVRTALGAEKSHEAVLTAAMDRVRTDLAARREAATDGSAPRAVVLSHAFVTGGAPSDSERDVSVGGVADAPALVYAGVDYVALGHLHGPQEIANPDGPTIRYSGSPLAYSFSEQAHAKSVTIVDVSADGSIELEVVPAPVPRALAKLTGELDTLLADPEPRRLRGLTGCGPTSPTCGDPRTPWNGSAPASRTPSSSPGWRGSTACRCSRRTLRSTRARPRRSMSCCRSSRHVTSHAPTEEDARLARESVDRVRLEEMAE